MYLLDTSIASHIIKGDIARVRQRLLQVPINDVAISAVTEAELHYGVARRGHPALLVRRVHEFLVRVQRKPWTSHAASTYGALRAATEARGLPLSALDMMIAAHAKAEAATLVTSDRAFSFMHDGPMIEDWTR